MKSLLKWLLALQFVLLGGVVYGGTVTYYHTDVVGSVALESNASGRISKVVEYRPYGKPEIDAVGSGPGFTGHVNDSNTGLVYMGARYYDPQIGQFISADPYTAAPGNNYSITRYGYANGNPYKYNDPNGRIGFFALLGLFFAGGTAAVHSDFANAPASEAEHQSLGIMDHIGALPGLQGSKGMTGLKMAGDIKKVRTAEQIAADQALAAGKTSGAASAFYMDGKLVAVAVSAEEVPHTRTMLGLLMGSRGARAPWHGGCSEIACLNKVMSQGIDPKGGVMRTVWISSDPAKHGTPRPPCSTCSPIGVLTGVKLE